MSRRRRKVHPDDQHVEIVITCKACGNGDELMRVGTPGPDNGKPYFDFPPSMDGRVKHWVGTAEHWAGAQAGVVFTLYCRRGHEVRLNLTKLMWRLGYEDAARMGSPTSRRVKRLDL